MFQHIINAIRSGELTIVHTEDLGDGCITIYLENQNDPDWIGAQISIGGEHAQAIQSL